ncbi:glycosyltransferase family 4 protein [Clostridiisalibacter paucivorans]|uniref:glycosyltransferase family 4 protein n=1 Tax=Clostridiisalibacter paucivorans TaxID=408753 RepID=UPI00047ACDC6|nr:glycosyltransferase family 4 protein [Clostridiisalibacter paucivorans]
MKILHIACGFSYSKVYDKLFKALYEKGSDFEVYAPQHTYTDAFEINSEKYVYDVISEKVINKIDKILYFTKIRKMTKSVISKFDLSGFSLLHAHSLFSDGAIAYEIFKRFNIPYIVAVRNTDINQYYKKGIHLRPYAYNILLNAYRVVFISESYREKVLTNTLPKKIAQLIQKKSLVIPNGIDEFWFNQKSRSKEINDNVIKLLFVGRIDVNKNLENTVKTSKLLNAKGVKCNLIIVGDGPLKEKLESKYDFEFVHFKGSVNNKEILKNIYLENDILVVPSYNETFGLVYIEAMSCGTPVVFSKGQAIEGLFPIDNIGKSVNPNDPKSIATAIIDIINNYNKMSINCINSIDQFNWDKIATKYMTIYKEY